MFYATVTQLTLNICTSSIAVIRTSTKVVTSNRRRICTREHKSTTNTFASLCSCKILRNGLLSSFTVNSHPNGHLHCTYPHSRLTREQAYRSLLPFHSSLRYLRSEDRSIHEHAYPQLYYPEIYLLEGGYKAFYEHSKVGLAD